MCYPNQNSIPLQSNSHLNYAEGNFPNYLAVVLPFFKQSTIHHLSYSTLQFFLLCYKLEILPQIEVQLSQDSYVLQLHILYLIFLKLTLPFLFDIASANHVLYISNQSVPQPRNSQVGVGKPTLEFLSWTLDSYVRIPMSNVGIPMWVFSFLPRFLPNLMIFII